MEVCGMFRLSDVTVIGGPLARASQSEVDSLERELGVQFPSGYREYVTILGQGVLGGCYVRVYPPWEILRSSNSFKHWRERIQSQWFWSDSPLLDRPAAAECILIGDTVDGDEIVFHPRQPEEIFVFPRHEEKIIAAGLGLFEAIDWLCESGILTEAFEERDFEPFDTRGDGGKAC